jgi:hypothetical protein
LLPDRATKHDYSERLLTGLRLEHGDIAMIMRKLHVKRGRRVNEDAARAEARERAERLA